MMTIGDQVPVVGFLSLPDDVLFVIFGHCSVRSLGRLARTCQRIERLVARDSVWKKYLKDFTLIQSYTSQNQSLPTKERYRLARNWNLGCFSDSQVIRHGTKQIPWLQMDEDGLWASDKQIIKYHRIKPNGRLAEINRKRFQTNGNNDVCRFKVTGSWLVAGYCDGSVWASKWEGAQNAGRWGYVARLNNAHAGTVHSVDAHSSSPSGGGGERLVVVSGSRDHTVRVWGISGDTGRGDNAASSTVSRNRNMHERVWSVALHPDAKTFLVGSSGLNSVAPLSMWNTESGVFLCNLGQNYRDGAGVLDIQFDSDHLVYTCGYDTYVRLWDLRTSCTDCVGKWEDPFDETVYCVKGDGDNAILSGTARHGLTRLWDKRMTTHVQMYFTGGYNSPVYSLAFDSSRLYTALDRGVNMLNFSKKKT